MKRTYRRESSTFKRKRKKGRAAYKAGHVNEDKVRHECERAIEEYDCKGHAELGYKSSKDVVWSTGNGNIIFNIECRQGKKVNWREVYKLALSKIRGGSNPVAHCTDINQPAVMIVDWKLGREMLAAMARIEEKLEERD